MRINHNVLQVYHSVMNRNSGDIPEQSGETNGMEYIDDVHRSGALHLL